MSREPQVRGSQRWPGGQAEPSSGHPAATWIMLALCITSCRALFLIQLFYNCCLTDKAFHRPASKSKKIPLFHEYSGELETPAKNFPKKSIFRRKASKKHHVNLSGLRDFPIMYEPSLGQLRILETWLFIQSRFLDTWKFQQIGLNGRSEPVYLFTYIPFLVTVGRAQMTNE